MSTNPELDRAIDRLLRLPRPVARTEYSAAEFNALLETNARLRAALKAIIEADDTFRRSLPDDWEGDPVTDACNAARPLSE